MQWLVFITLLNICHSVDQLLICYFCMQMYGPRRVVCRATLDDPELDDLMARMEEQVWDVWVVQEVWDVRKYDMGGMGVHGSARR